MSARDFFHNAVKTALVKDGWEITDDPFSVRFGGVNMSIDLGAEQMIAAQKQEQKIAVEIKSFLAGTSAISEFHTALGQFLNYRMALSEKYPKRILYLAVPNTAYKTFFTLKLPQLMLQNHQVKLIVFNPDQEVIVQWKN